MSASQSRPPRFYTRLFHALCREEYYKELQGDLEEEYYLNLVEFGQKKARMLYRKEVLKMIRPSVIKKVKTSSHHNNTFSMYRNFLKVAFRNLSKNRLFSFINITGLAIGMSVGLLIVNLVYDAAKFDEFHENKSRMYRVLSTPARTGFSSDETATAPATLAQRMRDELPALEEVVRIRRRFTGRIKKTEGSLFTEGIYADDNFFQVFSFELDRGNPATALKNPFSIVLTKSLAEALMPGVDPMGKVLEIPERGEFIVTGVVHDPPKHSHMQFDAVVSFSTVRPLEAQGLILDTSEDWEDFNTSYVYFMMGESQSIDQVNNWLNSTGAEAYSPYENLTCTFDTQKVTAIVPGKDLNNQIGAEFTPLPIIILGAVAMMIVLSACFNYTNLSIARAMRRSKEIGIRKVVGSSRTQIFHQFTIETVMVTVVAVCFSVLLFRLIKPLFITSIPRIDQVMQFETPPELMIFFLLFAIAVGLTAGVFPAFFFSKVKPLLALRSKGSMKLFSHISIRKALIVAQFSISIFFLITMNTVIKQYRYTMGFDMGFEKENVLNIALNDNAPERLITELQKIPEVQQISTSSMIMGTGQFNRTLLKNPATNDSLYNNYISASPSFFELHDLQLVAGDVYSKRQTDEQLNKMVVNEQFVKFYGYASPQDILGAQFYVGSSAVTITGVVKDFNYQFIEEPIHSLMLFEATSNMNYVNLTVQSSDLIATLGKIDQAWESIDEDSEMQAKFMDAEIEETTGFLLTFTRVFGFLGFVAASIACLGLLGMAVFNAETRTKEIGIRKAVGATIGNLMMVLSKGFIKLIAIAGLVGGTIGYFVLDQLILAQIHYRVNVGVIEIAGAALILFFLAFLAVGSQTWKAARANPVKALKYE